MTVPSSSARATATATALLVAETARTQAAATAVSTDTISAATITTATLKRISRLASLFLAVCHSCLLICLHLYLCLYHSLHLYLYLYDIDKSLHLSLIFYLLNILYFSRMLLVTYCPY